MFSVGDENKFLLCLDCCEKWSHITNMEYLQNAATLNQALDEMDMSTGIPSSGGRVPVQALARAMQRSHTLNNIHISQSQIGVFNTGTIQRIDAAITLSKGSDAKEIGALINNLTQAVIQSSELNATQQKEIIDLTETLAEEVVGRRKPATITAVVKAIIEKVTGVAALAGAADKLWQAIKSLLPV
jgi:hypothetical protein